MPLLRSSTTLATVLLFLFAFSCAPALAQAPHAAPLHGEPARGMALYQGCMGCHSLDENDVGPKHRGVVGRRAASVPDYAYSPALRASGLIWNEANLDAWLANPQRLVPGARMFFSVAGAQDRADIIAYLRDQKSEENGARTSVTPPLAKAVPTAQKPVRAATRAPITRRRVVRTP